MKTFKNIQELTEWFEAENYYYRGQQFDNYNEAQKEAENRFDDAENISLDMVKMSKYYIEDLDDVVILSQYEAHAGDSGVPADDYFYAYIINK